MRTLIGEAFLCKNLIDRLDDQPQVKAQQKLLGVEGLLHERLLELSDSINVVVDDFLQCIKFGGRLHAEISFDGSRWSVGFDQYLLQIVGGEGGGGETAQMNKQQANTVGFIWTEFSDDF